MKRKYSYNRITKIATCELFDKGKVIVGTAKVHPDDVDFASEYTGIAIAEYKAKIKRYNLKLKENTRKMRALEKEMLNLINQRLLIQELNMEIEGELDSFLTSKEKAIQNYKKLNK